jgi:hypothetical protein
MHFRGGWNSILYLKDVCFFLQKVPFQQKRRLHNLQVQIPGTFCALAIPSAGPFLIVERARFSFE